MEHALAWAKKFIPRSVFRAFQPLYHYTLAILGHYWYGRPSTKIKIVGITGTKGKSSTTEIIDAVLRAGGFKTAVAGTIRFSVNDEHEPNLFKQSMPGRMYLQRFLRRAVCAGCDWVVIEMTSEGAKQFRNRGIFLDALVFTNLSPEHIESHGSFDAYKDCKLDIARYSLSASPKRPRALVYNHDDPHSTDFVHLARAEQSIPFGLSLLEHYHASTTSSQFRYRGVDFSSPLLGEHNIKNMHAGICVGEFAGLDLDTIKTGIESVHVIPGRGQEVDHGQPFRVIVDYAHTNDSLEAIYHAWQGVSIVGILGACGGGRDRWKRPDFGRIAQTHCRYTVLTNEDPYDEDPMQIINDMEQGMDKNSEGVNYIKILDRRDAFRHAFAEARDGEVILITGKGTDPYIMGPHGSREKWSDLEVARETLCDLGYPTP